MKILLITQYFYPENFKSNDIAFELVKRGHEVDALKEKHNIILDHSRKTLDIIFASPQEAKALNINKGYPLLRIKSTIHDVENTITNLCQQLCIGDKFTFIV